MSNRTDSGLASGLSGREVLLQGLACGFGGRAWYGGTLLGALRKCPPDARLWAPRGRKNVWEQLLHVAYWKHRVLLKLGVKRKFGRPGSNWPGVPGTTDDSAWKRDVQFLEETHRELVDAVEQLEVVLESQAFLIVGSAQHDVYHDGQVRWLIRQWKMR
jgi:hypothetical protein